MYFIYLIKSSKNGDIYVGSTEDLDVRFIKHNYGKVKSTKFYRPWRFIHYEAFNTRADAVRRERFLKAGQQKELLKEKYKDL